MQKKIILASLAILGSIQLSAYTYEVSPLIGKNFTESGSLVDDSTAYGIRLNKYISQDNAIMFGYTHINGADYKKTFKRTKGLRSCNTVANPCKSKINECNKWTHCGHSGGDTSNTNSGTHTNSHSSTDNNNNSNSHNNGTNNANQGSNSNGSNNTTTGNTSNTGSGQTTTPTKPAVKVLSNNTRETNINRFYINGLHNIKTQYSRLIPYVYGGFGYEHVENEFADNKSQGFFNAGGGLKFRINDKFNLVSDIQGIKKFTSNDLDILGSLGVSFLFGNAFQPEPEALVASGLEDIQPAAPKREITIVQVEPQPEVEAPVVTAPTGEYYVQIAAGFKTDMETGCKHTRDLRDAGIPYDIKYTTIKGKNAAIVVVGPYETKREAASHLPELRKFSKDAFVKKIKS